jgi:hypothetical protein
MRFTDPVAHVFYAEGSNAADTAVEEWPFRPGHNNMIDAALKRLLDQEPLLHPRIGVFRRTV